MKFTIKHFLLSCLFFGMVLSAIEAFFVPGAYVQNMHMAPELRLLGYALWGIALAVGLGICTGFVWLCYRFVKLFFEGFSNQRRMG